MFKRDFYINTLKFVTHIQNRHTNVGTRYFLLIIGNLSYVWSLTLINSKEYHDTHLKIPKGKNSEIVYQIPNKQLESISVTRPSLLISGLYCMTIKFPFNVKKTRCILKKILTRSLVQLTTIINCNLT